VHPLVEVAETLRGPRTPSQRTDYACLELDDAVPTGGTYTYTWLVPDRARPGPHDGSSVMWMYHSHTDEVADTYAGLMGPIEVTARGPGTQGRQPEGRRS
jgi:hypothetical protein